MAHWEQCMYHTDVNDHSDKGARNSSCPTYLKTGVAGDGTLKATLILNREKLIQLKSLFINGGKMETKNQFELKTKPKPKRTQETKKPRDQRPAAGGSRVREVRSRPLDASACASRKLQASARPNPKHTEQPQPRPRRRYVRLVVGGRWPFRWSIWESINGSRNFASLCSLSKLRILQHL